MAIVSVDQFRLPAANRKIVCGESVLSGGTNTGDVVTGLELVESFVVLTQTTAQKGFAVNETFPLSSGDVTVYSHSNDATFTWMAIGR